VPPLSANDAGWSALRSSQFSGCVAIPHSHPDGVRQISLLLHQWCHPRHTPPRFSSAPFELPSVPPLRYFSIMDIRARNDIGPAFSQRHSILFFTSHVFLLNFRLSPVSRSVLPFFPYPCSASPASLVSSRVFFFNLHESLLCILHRVPPAPLLHPMNYSRLCLLIFNFPCFPRWLVEVRAI